MVPGSVDPEAIQAGLLDDDDREVPAGPRSRFLIELSKPSEQACDIGDPAADGLYLDRTLLVHEIGAVTGAFLACRRALFDELGGFDADSYVVTSSDADFCVRARAAGSRVIYDPFLAWIHYESVSRGSDEQDYRKHWRAEAEHERWRENIADRPY
jgi:GT2 family glycosyltransferase